MDFTTDSSGSESGLEKSSLVSEQDTGSSTDDDQINALLDEIHVEEFLDQDDEIPDDSKGSASLTWTEIDPEISSKLEDSTYSVINMNKEIHAVLEKISGLMKDSNLDIENESDCVAFFLSEYTRLLLKKQINPGLIAKCKPLASQGDMNAYISMLLKLAGLGTSFTDYFADATEPYQAFAHDPKTEISRERFR